jgi:outer membrane protein OmpA-like peptidoglycan-associated protein
VLLVASRVLWALCSILLQLIPPTGESAIVAPEIYFAGEHVSEWLFQGSQMKCVLKHEIPQFGVGRFERLVGEQLKFRIRAFQPVPVAVEGMIREITPSWKQDRADPLIRKIALKEGLIPLKLVRQPSDWLLSSLAKGQIPSIDFVDWDDTRKTVHVRLSPVNFQKPYREFKRCLKNISGKGYEDFRYTEVHFPLDVDSLGVEQQSRLKSLAAYVAADESVEQIEIDGHADDQGTRGYNIKLSERRAKNVETYLRSAGIGNLRITRQAYGEGHPKIASRSEHARAMNRRAEIRLIRR